MKSTVHFPIPHGAKVLVDAGATVGAKTVLVMPGKFETSEIIPLAKILGIGKTKVARYLKKRIGEEVTSGDIIAEKRSFFSSSIIKSPTSGKLAQIDLSSGTLTLLVKKKETFDKIITPIAGRITNISKSYIELEVEAEDFNIIKGQGKDVLGKLKFVDFEILGVLDVPEDVEGNIIVCNTVAQESITKLEVLGVFGLVLLHSLPTNSDLSWVQVNEDVFRKLAHHTGQNIWVRPDSRQIVVWG